MSDKQKVDELRGELEAQQRSDPATVLAGQASAAVGQAQDAALKAREQLTPQIEAFAEKVKENPLAAVAIAVGVGYLLGRVVR